MDEGQGKGPKISNVNSLSRDSWLNWLNCFDMRSWAQIFKLLRATSDKTKDCSFCRTVPFICVCLKMGQSNIQWFLILSATCVFPIYKANSIFHELNMLKLGPSSKSPFTSPWWPQSQVQVQFWRSEPKHCRRRFKGDVRARARMWDTNMIILGWSNIYVYNVQWYSIMCNNGDGDADAEDAMMMMMTMMMTIIFLSLCCILLCVLLYTFFY